MILLFGPAGAGKSMQGKLLASKPKFSWLSTGQLIRDSKNEKLGQIISTGKLIPSDTMNSMLFEKLQGYSGEQTIVLDGYPRKLEQAEWLVRNLNSLNQSIQQALVIDVPEDEIVSRLTKRGRADDTPNAIRSRLAIYHQETDPIIDYISTQGVSVVHIDGTGSVEEIHQRILDAVNQIVGE